LLKFLGELHRPLQGDNVVADRGRDFRLNKTLSAKALAEWSAILPLLLRMFSENNCRLPRYSGVEPNDQIGHLEDMPTRRPRGFAKSAARHAQERAKMG
jgi:hypothetical protein